METQKSRRINSFQQEKQQFMSISNKKLWREKRTQLLFFQSLFVACSWRKEVFLALFFSSTIFISASLHAFHVTSGFFCFPQSLPSNWLKGEDTWLGSCLFFRRKTPSFSSCSTLFQTKMMKFIFTCLFLVIVPQLTYCQLRSLTANDTSLQFHAFHPERTSNEKTRRSNGEYLLISFNS